MTSQAGELGDRSSGLPSSRLRGLLSGCPFKNSLLPHRFFAAGYTYKTTAGGFFH
jgi:hypothetical protein